MAAVRAHQTLTQSPCCVTTRELLHEVSGKTIEFPGIKEELYARTLRYEAMHLLPLQV